jgi:hypothetical protein
MIHVTGNARLLPLALALLLIATRAQTTYAGGAKRTGIFALLHVHPPEPQWWYREDVQPRGPAVVHGVGITATSLG